MSDHSLQTRAHLAAVFRSEKDIIVSSISEIANTRGIAVSYSAMFDEDGGWLE